MNEIEKTFQKPDLSPEKKQLLSPFMKEGVEIKASDKRLNIDPEDGTYFNAFLDKEGFLHLDIRTFLDDDKTRSSYFLENRASILVQVAVELFGKENINGISDYWAKPRRKRSDNYRVYILKRDELFSQGMEYDLACKEAAKKTWTGQIAAKLGFSEIRKKVLEENLNVDNAYTNSGVEVLFERPLNPVFSTEPTPTQKQGL